MIKVNYVHFFTAILLIFILGQCTYNVEYNEPDVIITEDVSFQDDIIPIFNESCNFSGCHNEGGKAPDLSPANAYDALLSGNYIDTIAPDNSELYQWMIGNRSLDMPLTGPDATYNALVLKWITEGAQNN